MPEGAVERGFSTRSGTAEDVKGLFTLFRNRSGTR